MTTDEEGTVFTLSTCLVCKQVKKFLDGSYFCSLYVSPVWNEGKIPHNVVPKRRTSRR